MTHVRVGTVVEEVKPPRMTPVPALALALQTQLPATWKAADDAPDPATHGGDPEGVVRA